MTEETIKAMIDKHDKALYKIAYEAGLKDGSNGDYTHSATEDKCEWYRNEQMSFQWFTECHTTYATYQVDSTFFYCPKCGREITLRG